MKSVMRYIMNPASTRESSWLVTCVSQSIFGRGFKI
jgi:hypothetical protein